MKEATKDRDWLESNCKKFSSHGLQKDALEDRVWQELKGKKKTRGKKDALEDRDWQEITCTKKGRRQRVAPYQSCLGLRYTHQEQF